MDARTDRRNGTIFLWANLLIYLAAPVRYIGVMQAALCDRLGASATLANLPTSFYFFGGIAPIVAVRFIPRRYERAAVVSTAWIICLAQALVGAALVLPFGAGLKIAVVIGQSLVLGLLNTIQNLYLMQCLGRGTTEAGRARALKLTFSLGPIAAVAGSLVGQFVLRHDTAALAFPRDFAVLYFIGVPTSAVMAWCCAGFELEPLADGPRPPFFAYTWGTLRNYFTNRRMACLWIGYLCWYATLQGFSNVSLYARHALGREPAAYAGLMMAIQFGTKAVAGYFVGVLYARKGVRAPLIVAVAVLGLGMLWAWNVPGYLYLLAFGFMGAGQLGGSYFPNALLSWKLEDAPRYIAILSLAGMLAGLAPAAHGFLTDHWGFSASFSLGTATAAAGLVLVLLIPVAAGEPAGIGEGR